MSASTKNTAKKKNIENPKFEATSALNQPFLSIKKIFWLVGIIAFFVFANSISNGYNLDDELVTKNHPLTSRGLEAVGAIFTSPYYSDEMGYAYGYRPMVHLSFAIEHQFFGENPNVSHFFNVLLFAFSTMLFFKFLIKLLGEKQLYFALLATLLFLVHPIHTEVVDSIKNRDELLAFLFIILSGISILKYVSENSLKSLFFIFLYFTIAMLSKKSVFPMVFVLPILFILTNEIKLRKLLIICFVLVIPGAIVAGEFELMKTGIFCTLPFIGIIPLYFFKEHFLSLPNFSWKLALSKPVFPFTLVILSAFCAVYFNQFYWTFLLLPFGVWALITDTKWAVVLLTCVLVLFDWRFQLNQFSMIAIFLGASYFFRDYFKTRKLDYMVAFPILAIVYFLIVNHSAFDIESLAAILLVCFLLIWKPILSLIFALVVFVTYAAFFTLKSFLPFTFLAVSLAYYLSQSRLKFNIYGAQLIFLLAILFVQFSISNHVFENLNQSQKAPVLKEFSVQNANTQVQGVIPKEGRSLDYIENTLVAPHSTTQTIGTGAQTLGEYLKLMVFPYELSFYYGFAKTSTVGLQNPWVWLSILGHLMLVFLALWQIKKRPLITIGVAWYLISILLFSNWIELVAGMVGERLAFTASAGFCLFVASIIWWLRPSFSFKKPSWIEFAVGTILILFLIKTVNRNAQWKNNITLMEQDIKHLSNSAQANNLLATNYYHEVLANPDIQTQEKQNYLLNASTYFQKSLEIYPEFSNAAYDLGRVSLALGNDSLAIVSYERFIKNNQRILFDPYYRLCDLYFKYNRLDDYLRIAKIIFKLDYKNKEVYHVLTRGYFLKKDYKNALKVINKARIKYPNDPQFKENQKIVSDSLALD